MRFLVHRKRALLLSLAGVVFGVAIFIGTQAQTQGFAKYFIDSSLGSNGAMIVRSRFRPRSPMLIPPKSSRLEASHRSYFEGIDDASTIMRVSRQFSDVVSCSPVLRGTVSARSGFETATVDLFGIEPALHLQTTDLSHQIIDGDFDDFRNNPNSVILGYRLASTLDVRAGDMVQLLPPGGEYRRLVVAAIARSGVGSIDATRIYSHARVAQTLLHKPYTASMIIYKLRDPQRAPDLAQHFETLFQHDTQSWQDREESTLQLFLTLRLSAAITVSLIILLAGFGIFNVLTMTVLSKVKEIAIFAFDGLPTDRYFGDFSLARRDDRRSRIGPRVHFGRARDVGNLAHPDSDSWFALRKPFFGDVGLAALSVGDLARDRGRDAGQLRAGAPRG